MKRLILVLTMTIVLILAIGLVPAQMTAKVGDSGSSNFWASHPQFAIHIFQTHQGGTIDIGWRLVDTNPEMFGAFWTSTTNNWDCVNNVLNRAGSRTDLAKAKMSTAAQVVAAMLNRSLDYPMPLPLFEDAQLTPAKIQMVMAGSDTERVYALGRTLKDYNGSGDRQIYDSHMDSGRADKAYAQDNADRCFWNDAVQP